MNHFSMKSYQNNMKIFSNDQASPGKTQGKASSKIVRSIENGCWIDGEIVLKAVQASDKPKKRIFISSTCPAWTYAQDIRDENWAKKIRNKTEKYYEIVRFSYEQNSSANITLIH